ncbi:MAG: hypothetical protein AAFP13_11640 [Pseudomonadota bacterium]
MIKTKLVVPMLIGTLTLTACATDPLQAYPEADTVSDCEVLAEADENQRERAMQSQRSSGSFLGDLLGSAVGSGIIEAEINNSLAGCITRVTGAPPAPGQLPATGTARVGALPVRPAPAQTVGCVDGLGPMQRGTLICPGF